MRKPNAGTIIIAIASILALASGGCSKSRQAGQAANAPGEAAAPASPGAGGKAAAVETALDSGFLEPLPGEKADLDTALPKRQYSGGKKSSMPEKYLADAFELGDIPPSPFGKLGVAVVGSDKAALYPDAFAAKPKDLAFLDGLKKISAIPLGTILPIYDTYKAPEGASYDSLIEFDGQVNWFYLTEYKGRKGIVFGSDLAGLGKGPEAVARLAYFYNKPTAAPAFVRTIGEKEIPRGAEASLASDYLAFDREVRYRLDADHPDDLVAAYQEAVTDRGTTLFVTTDLMVHCLHLLFDRMLADTEENIFIPKLKALIQGYLDRIADLQAADGWSSPEYTDALALARTYFAIGKRLLAMAPPATDSRGEEDRGPASKALSAEDVLSIDDAAKGELELILKAEGFAKSPNFLYEEDYSQFKPRGHYTKNERLSAYFRCMMFFGRLNLYMDFSTEQAREVSEKLAPVAIVANRIHAKDPELKKLWRDVFDPITYLVGASDDISFDDIAPRLGAAADADLEKWMAEGKLIPFVEEMSKKLRVPRIQGNITYGNANAASVEGSGDLFGEAPKGWRLFGQRFVLDSSWTDRLTGGGIFSVKDPGVSRTMARGLDVAASLGSRKAYEALAGEREDYPYYAKELDRIRAEVAGMGEKDWNATFYTRYLDIDARILAFDVGSGFYFTQKPLWDIKALQTGQAAWAELRHDTILYVKQSYAEKSGGGDREPTWRTRPFDRPIHYVEPNLPFFYALAGTVEGALPLLEKNGFLTPFFLEKFQDFYAVAGRLSGIVELEAADRPISTEDNEFIVSVPSLLARIVLPAPGGGYMEDLDQLKMALVADVHTDADAGAVLEVATGRPLKLYVALNDGQGGKRIAVGFGYSYYEFEHPMSDRLNDEQWKAFIYDERTTKAQLEAKRPSWLKGRIP